jgi:hypothetical protein
MGHNKWGGLFQEIYILFSVTLLYLCSIFYQFADFDELV